jgi:hypothetical protein
VIRTRIQPAPAAEPIEFEITRTRRGRWRRYTWPDGSVFAEYTSRRRWRGLPLLHYTRGRSPETGRRVVARGVVAVGRVAVGVVAVGQAATGVIAIGQLGIGALAGLGQATSGIVCLGQLAAGFGFGAGQLASGYVAIGQLALGHYVLAQAGFGDYLWTPERADPEAMAFFTRLAENLKLLFAG